MGKYTLIKYNKESQDKMTMILVVVVGVCRQIHESFELACNIVMGPKICLH
jgi:hypothetical protein